jgi:hypothetical protein
MSGLEYCIDKNPDLKSCGVCDFGKVISPVLSLFKREQLYAYILGLTGTIK